MKIESLQNERFMGVCLSLREREREIVYLKESKCSTRLQCGGRISQHSNKSSDLRSAEEQ